MKLVFRCFFMIIFFSLVVIIIASIALHKNPIYPKLKLYNYNSYQNIISGYAKAIDGDSIIINQKEIRLYMIDAPEISQYCYDNKGNSYKCGIDSLRYLKSIINNNIINCYYQKKDIYDRYLAICFNDIININYKMIESGMAIIYNPANNNDKIIHNLENIAKTKKIGIWKGHFMIPKHYRYHNKR
ncbi:MAG: nuclease [Rickettsiales bacterium]|nr:nuclease [Rickettsiales bacterium]